MTEFKMYLCMIKKFALLSTSSLLVIFLLSSCSSSRHQPVRIPPPIDGDELSSRLYLLYDTWKATPYKEGGLSRNGVDCSGFVYLIYRDLLGSELPRTTAKQMDMGRAVSLSSLRSGDLVFFKTGWFSRHVGIYLEESRFLHASSSKGVTISSLREKYWKDAFSMAKRIDLR